MKLIAILWILLFDKIFYIMSIKNRSAAEIPIHLIEPSRLATFDRLKFNKFKKNVLDRNKKVNLNEAEKFKSLKDEKLKSNSTDKISKEIFKQPKFNLSDQLSVEIDDQLDLELYQNVEFEWGFLFDKSKLISISIYAYNPSKNKYIHLVSKNCVFDQVYRIHFKAMEKLIEIFNENTFVFKMCEKLDNHEILLVIYITDDQSPSGTASLQSTLGTVSLKGSKYSFKRIIKSSSFIFGLVFSFLLSLILIIFITYYCTKRNRKKVINQARKVPFFYSGDNEPLLLSNDKSLSEWDRLVLNLTNSSISSSVAAKKTCLPMVKEVNLIYRKSFDKRNSSSQEY